jgi:2-polyprenyl-6-methoxyphenol hydroxylase-like FAD-dependent oxidoreductase
VRDCDVLICGLGPVGQLLALLLGDLGVETVAVDEAHQPHELPRAAVVDDEVLRIFQAVGLDREILAAAQVQRAVSYVTGRGRAIRVFRPEQGDLGQPPLVSIHQPSMERAMVAALEGRGEVELRWGERVEALDPGRESVTAWIRPVEDGRSWPLRGRYLVGCDGARSAVRDRAQIPFGGSTFAQRWLVVDALVDRPPASAPHPHFVGDTDRPTVCLPMSPGRHRWEWMLHPGEDEAPFLEPARIRRLLGAWVRDEHVEVERAVVYTFHARAAQRWRAGRVLLAGDAAHVMPPFVGQGFSSGARDAGNLAWKLDAVLHGAAQRLLDTYEAERRPHVTSMQSRAVRWGRVVQTTRPTVGLLRDAAMEVLDRTGALGWLQARAKPLPTYGAGAFAVAPSRLSFRRSVGSLFPQPDRLDDRLGRGWSVVSRSPAATRGWRDAGLHVVELDPDPWLSRRDAGWALLRPDRFVFACGGPAEVPTALRALRETVGSGLRTDHSAMAAA